MSSGADIAEKLEQRYAGQGRLSEICTVEIPNGVYVALEEYCRFTQNTTDENQLILHRLLAQHYVASAAAKQSGLPVILNLPRYECLFLADVLFDFGTLQSRTYQSEVDFINQVYRGDFMLAAKMQVCAGQVFLDIAPAGERKAVSERFAARLKMSSRPVSSDWADRWRGWIFNLILLFLALTVLAAVAGIAWSSGHLASATNGLLANLFPQMMPFERWLFVVGITIVLVAVWRQVFHLPLKILIFALLFFAIPGALAAQLLPVKSVSWYHGAAMGGLLCIALFIPNGPYNARKAAAEEAERRSKA